LRLSWAEGLKIATEIRISPHAGGTTLTIKDIYQLPEGEPDEETLREVDKSLTPWGIAIRRHVLNRARWGGLPFYGKIMRWFYAMPPRHRRISRLIAWSTLIEFVVFLLVFAVFQVETGG
jgi:hypothetical protein